MRVAELGLTKQDIKDKVNKYMIETYERFDFLAETGKGMYIYDEKNSLIWIFMRELRLILWATAVKALSRQFRNRLQN